MRRREEPNPSLGEDAASLAVECRSVNPLVEKIDHSVQTGNSKSYPFTWTATANSILDKIERLCEHISGTGHSHKFHSFLTLVWIYGDLHVWLARLGSIPKRSSVTLDNPLRIQGHMFDRPA